MLAAFVSAVEVALGAVTLVLAIRALPGNDNRSTRPHAEGRQHLLMLLAATLAIVGLVAWPLLYLTLASYVPRWPGIMCIQGVTRVGRGSEGLPGSLPGLLWTLGILRPAAVFAAGCWMALHLANRRIRTAPLSRQVLLVLAAAALVSAWAGLTELAYLAIPKAERFLATGCCTVAPDALARAGGFQRLGGILGAAFLARHAGTFFFFGGAALAIAIAWMLLARDDRPIGRGPLLLLAAASAGFVVVSASFLTETASPIVLRLPHHHCAWCLLSSAPETIVGVALLLGAAFSVGWAAIVACATGSSDSRATDAGQIRSLLVAALFGFAGSLILGAIEVSLA